MVARNEAVSLETKLRNLAGLDYPRENIEIVVVSDGSGDATAEILGRTPGIRFVPLPEPVGKASALNRGIAIATGELVVCVDVRQKIDSQALRFLAGNFADPSVGCVSGELVLVSESSEAAGKADGVGVYWQMEKLIRRLESETGSVVGATGALYAVRRSLVRPLPAGTLCDDMFIPFQVVRQGYRVVFEPRAIALDGVCSDWRHEFRRKVRTLAGNYQLLRLAPWLLSRANPLRFELFSHKLLRLAVPFALLLALTSSLIASGWIYRAAEVFQLCFYGIALLTWALPRGRMSGMAALPFTFVMLNAAAVLGLIKFMTGEKDIWVTQSLRPERVQ